MPSENGHECKRHAVRVIVIHGKRWSYQVAVCNECAAYAEKEFALVGKTDGFDPVNPLEQPAENNQQRRTK